ncbi:hypothetical protein [Pseudoruegeria sp. SHC-113]|uniref:hypothetical protein n=1 Tax=Pseudoruegeria sp. SHC-113 TaxID=2855439 RepID=UPI0021BAA736|nr:hypothetical protein [Pseudoruegeria sp. SHC-113]MCT8159938.1 hypothetical protein [Pseudoruegeria sp. SHC-113]
MADGRRNRRKRRALDRFALVTAGGTLASLRRGHLTLRGWVIRAFILIDAAIALAMIVALLSALTQRHKGVVAMSSSKMPISRT